MPTAACASPYLRTQTADAALSMTTMKTVKKTFF